MAELLATVPLALALALAPVGEPGDGSRKDLMNTTTLSISDLTTSATDTPSSTSLLPPRVASAAPTHVGRGHAAVAVATAVGCGGGTVAMAITAMASSVSKAKSTLMVQLAVVLRVR